LAELQRYEGPFKPKATGFATGRSPFGEHAKPPEYRDLVVGVPQTLLTRADEVPYSQKNGTSGWANGALRFRCKGCKKDFTITSGTLFGSHKPPLRGYLAAIAVFCNEVKGKSALALSRELGLSYKSAFVLLHKLREAMAEEMRGRVVGGEGKEAEIDGGYFGGYVKPANLKEDRIDRRFARN
jgi:transposase-like protein